MGEVCDVGGVEDCVESEEWEKSEDRGECKESKECEKSNKVWDEKVESKEGGV